MRFHSKFSEKVNFSPEYQAIEYILLNIYKLNFSNVFETENKLGNIKNTNAIWHDIFKKLVCYRETINTTQEVIMNGICFTNNYL